MADSPEVGQSEVAAAGAGRRLGVAKLQDMSSCTLNQLKSNAGSERAGRRKQLRKKGF